MAGKSTRPTRKIAREETDLIHKLAKILDETNLSEIEIEKDGLKLRVTRSLGEAAAIVHSVPAQTSVPVTAAPGSKTKEPAKLATDDPDAIKSPMVGTAYTRPSPDKDSFVNVGDSVKEGDTVMLIEAMKTFNPIKAEKAGTVKAVLVQDAQPVEFGEALIVIN